MAIKLPRLLQDWLDRPNLFSRNWNEAMTTIESNINDILAAQAAAAAAQTSADTAQTSADDAQTSADNAQATASSANANANTRVLKSAGPSFLAPTGTLSRTAYASYVSAVVSNPPTQAEVQAISDGLQALSQHVVAVITDLRSNQALTP